MSKKSPKKKVTKKSPEKKPVTKTAKEVLVPPSPIQPFPAPLDVSKEFKAVDDQLCTICRTRQEYDQVTYWMGQIRAAINSNNARC